jgi:hypothetical protein
MRWRDASRRLGTSAIESSYAPQLQVLSLLALLVQKVWRDTSRRLGTSAIESSYAPQVLSLLALLVQKSTNTDT